MTARALMLQGTGSDVGKSVIVAGLCRAAVKRGLTVAPFKPQNMSNNAAACESGGEIGRAQALQARAAGLAFQTDFNPVLLKPQTDRTAQIILNGKVLKTMEASRYMAMRDTLLDGVMESFNRLIQTYDIVFVEGAGSPAEINLRDRDIANMGFARKAGVPVCLIGDIDKGGVIASIVGTKNVIAPDDAAMITGFLINKFRGDPDLFTEGVHQIGDRTGWPCYGVVPWLPITSQLPAEDAVGLAAPVRHKAGSIKIAAPMLSRMANFDDADPLRLDPSVDFQWVGPGQPIPRDVDVIILFGTKSTIGDLDFVRAQGWDHDIIAHARSGGRILGLCGGYQMLGQTITDPEGSDGQAGARLALGLLDVETRMTQTKTVRPVEGKCALDEAPITGYEIHTGETTGRDTKRPMIYLTASADGARSANGKIEGTYVHGLFADDAFRTSWLSRTGKSVPTGLVYDDSVDQALDQLADGLEESLDMEALLESTRTPGWSPVQS